ncbi:MAG: M1 family metallopeptidase, partial [Pricia sp.]
MKLLFFCLSMLPFFSAYAQRQPQVDFTRAEVSLAIDPAQKSVQGQVEYDFRVLQDVDSVFLDARNMDFSSVLLNGKKVKYSNMGNRVSIAKDLKSGKEYRLELDYTCTPKQTVYFSGWDDDIPDNEQVWTQGQGKYTSHWLPSFDDMEEKVEFDLNITFDASYEVIANGAMKLDPVDAKSTAAYGSKTWHFDMDYPMSSYLLAFAIGNYNHQELRSKSGIPIKNYYYPEDSLRMEPTYRYTKEIFDFLENEIGIPYPWQNYKQIPVHDFLYAGMENTGTTIFSDGYVIDSTAFTDKNYVNVNAHELAHQWFGNLVTEKDAEHHWLHEGFATYYAYLAEKKLFGDDYFYWKLYSTLTQLKEQVEQGNGQSLLNPKASSLTFYEKGAWALFILRERIGDKAFQKGIRDYLRKYQFQNVTVSDFLEVMEKASNDDGAESDKRAENASSSDLANFKADWLSSEDIPFEEAKSILAKNSASLQQWYELQSNLKNAQGKDIDYAKYWNATPSIHLKKHLLENHIDQLPDAIIQQAFASDTVPVRQALSMAKDIERFP